MNKTPAELKAEILRLTREFSALTHGANRAGADNTAPFVAGQTTVPYAARVFNADEVEAAVGATLDFWLTLGPEGAAFETELAALLGVKHSLLVNSGSSANLVAFSTLTTHKLPAAKRIAPGDEVITVAAGFPTTVAPIIQGGAVPVFIDNDPATGNARVEQLEAAFAPGKTKAVMMAHTLGNPFDLGAVLEFCRKHDLWLIEDNCDALGCTYSLPVARANALGFKENSPGIPGNGTHITRFTGAWGDISTQSFYPPHHLTMGEGGAVSIVHRPPLKTYAESFRDWGRDCWCASGKDDTCGKRFQWQLGELPKGYDHKYIYSHLGYNLKPLDPQAAIGRQQLKKLPAFIEARKKNWETLRAGLADLGEFFDFSLPTHATAWNSPSSVVRSPSSVFSWDATGCRTDCSWFGFMLRVKAGAPFSHTDLGRHLDAKKIGNRMLFGGNLLRQPAFVQLKKDRPAALRVIGDLPGADELMHRALFLGTYPGLTPAMLAYELEVIHEFVRSR
ncbi:lipopolysaccharide biosynthesis protein RfbH [Opitutus sp. GAS368]|uniref:lipopolysaccharide biosynthesis protein RfbH n=1 Tax=Opitutus sp. GAS368 TaxID=1882749 RepID=UPI00087C7633|nr:lipopolysaccharide biosynthesis protein RfbH [Opitutus sp. GAS368]SDS08553.1 CDP-6-deoxy-D-xylo-4-hexulose-3-dehydrase [Opitutus sp. GAS368]